MSIPASALRAASQGVVQGGNGAGIGAVQGAIREASARTGVDFSYLMAKAAQESSFDPNAKAATSSATGLYQFIDRTWLGMVQAHGAQYGYGQYAAQIQNRPDGTPTVADPKMRQEILDLRRDPRMSALLAAEYARDNKAYLEETVGGKVGSTELYLAHFLGAGGASKFLSALRQNPQQAADDIVPEAASANHAVFYDGSGRARSMAEIYQRMAAKFDNAAGTLAPGTWTPGRASGDGPSGGWGSEGSAKGKLGDVAAGNGLVRRTGEPISLFTVMVLSQLATPGEDGGEEGGKGASSGSRRAAVKNAPGLQSMAVQS